MVAFFIVEDFVHVVRLFREPIRCSSGGGGTREAGGIVAESLIGLRITCKPTLARSNTTNTNTNTDTNATTATTTHTNANTNTNTNTNTI